ncbi:PH domain-containing protein [Aeromicrobium sp. CF3.5]|uniref:PH domain-containing protein n=1 Tax=Aeromicrobium sp. CF3.5 TaxID=3373078 RepID=UPI003EE78367
MSEQTEQVGPEAVGLRTHPLTALVQGALWAAGGAVALLGSAISGDGWGDLGLLVSLGIAVVAGLVLGLGFGYLSWLFTRYVIDGTELRITSGVLTKASRRIPYERIQSVDIAEPLVARVLGLAELRIEMAGGSKSRTSLRFLPLADVRELRRLLLAHAHGQDIAEPIEDADAREDDEDRRSLITRVPPQRIIIGTLLSLDLAFAVFGLLVALAVAIWFGEFLVAIGGLLPFGSAVFSIVTKRVIEQWDFQLSRGERGLRIERGLLSRTSQTIPYDRVQGIAIKEPLVWRRFGWLRLEVDVAGYAGQSSEDGSTSVSTLLPISDAPLAHAIIAELIPGTLITPETRTAAPSRAKLFAPIGWRYRWAGADDSAFIASQGWIQRTTSLVPHHKTQSVELKQGPLQRWRNVATVEVHSPPGPVNADGTHLDAASARVIWQEQLDRI